ncbi:MAG: polyphosphate kinase 2 [Acidimicrobiia bacterium]
MAPRAGHDRRDGQDPRHMLPTPERPSREVYERELRALQVELVKLQSSLIDTGRRVVIVFEGRDTAGKGGMIQRFREHLNPRRARHVALDKPNDTERGQWYFQRYAQHLPTAGDIVLFDRSWYNRAGVEWVMDFCTVDEHARFLRQAPDFEQFLVDDGVHLVKLWLAVNKDEQARRLEARAHDPLKEWKLSTLDEYAQTRWDKYTEAQNTTFAFTDTPYAPWWVVNNNDKRTGRLNAMRHVLNDLEYGDKDTQIARPPDPAIVARPADMFPRKDAP